MQVNHEKEFHTTITKDLYELLLSKYDFDYSLNIVNTYFSLIDTRYMLRLRSTNESEFELTLKINNENENLELNISLTQDEYLAIKDDPTLVNKYMNEYFKKYQINLKNIKIIGDLRCFRYEKRYKDYLLVVDKNSYNNFIDYDIEVESDDINYSKEIIIKIFSELHYINPLNIDSKSKRFLKSFNK